ncbi:MAG: copper resistance CopC family protein [Sporichthyaceae bacterium]
MGVASLTLPALVLTASPAAAHAGLDSSDPKNGARLSDAPSQARLVFSEPIGPVRDGIQLQNASGQPVTIGKPVVSGKRIVVPFTGSLTNGRYTLLYRVVSKDNHPIKGSVTFRVAAASR